MTAQEEQTTTLTVLEAADGGIVTFDELESQGVRRPALVVYELQAAGCALQPMTVPGPGGHGRRGVRLSKIAQH